MSTEGRRGVWVGVGALLVAALVTSIRTNGGEVPAAPGPIDATTLRHKVLCGYQGWFRCPGDPSGQGWRHWSRDSRRINPRTLTVETWPDLSEFPDAETHDAPGFTYPDGSPARLFSSADPATVRRHFDWMREYGIDGVFVQRFLVDLGDHSFDEVLGQVRESSRATGRVFAVCYDLSGFPKGWICNALREDWTRLVNDLKLTRDDRYLHHDGKPVVFVWGLYPDRFGPATAHAILDIFQGDDGPRRATVVGGVPWSWRRESDPEWSRAFRRLDVISPWNVGNHTVEDGERQASTNEWAADLAESKRAGLAYLPVIYPGFSWTNLKGEPGEADTLPRLGGAFFWRQFSRAADLGIDMAYVAMFDEVDEGTAIFKVSNTPPTQARFQTFEGLPSDWYLRLTGEGSKLIRGERENSKALPIRP